MSQLQDLQAIVANLIAEVKAETARRAALTAAGNPAPTTYQVAGRQVDWNGYLEAMRDQIKAYRELAQTEDLFENHQHAYS